MKILVLCLPGIGDALMGTAMVKLLKRKNPEARIDVACMFGAVGYIFKNNPNVNAVYRLSLYKENKLTGLKQILGLRKNKYDISILAFPAFRREYHVVHWFLGAKKRIVHRFAKGFWGELHFLNTDLIDVDESEHNVINNLNLLGALGIDWREEIRKEEIKYDLILDKKDIEFGEEYIKELGWEGEGMIGIHPGSTNSPAALLRRWPIERYAEVAKYLIGKKGKKILIFVGPDEKDLGKNLFDMVDDPKNCRLLEGMEFDKALGVLNKINLLICNDNGFGHLAVALGKKILTLWASTNDRWSLPYDKEHVSLIRPDGFQPWYRYDLKRGVPNGAKGGMELMGVDDVISKLP